jgi:hypothetical protein
MSLVMAEGFEATFDQSDLTAAKGWMTSQSITINGNTVVGVPSRTGVPGTGLMLKGPYSNSAALPMATANAPDFGMNALNQSVYAAWQSGGFAVGVAATFNKVSQLEVAPYYCNQIQYDGAGTYWAVAVLNGTTGVVVHSTDLQNWTLTQAQPAAISPYSSIAVYGSGANAAIVVFQNNTGIGTGQFVMAGYGSTNGGVSWTVMLNTTNWNSYIGVGAITPLPGAPSGYEFFAYPPTNANGWVLIPGFVPAVGSGYTVWGATYYSGTTAVTNTSNRQWYSIGRTKSGWACLTGFSPTSGEAMPYAQQAKTTQWAMTPITSLQQLYSSTIPATQLDICYFAGGNVWISVGYGGIYTIANPGTPSSIQCPTTGVWAQPLNVGAGVVTSVDCNGSIAVAVGSDPLTGNGCLWTSKDGATWSKSDRFLWSGSGGSTFTGVFWDGLRFVLTGCLSNAVLAVSPDGIAWTPLYYPDYTEQTVAGTASLLGVYGGTQSNGSFVPWNNATGQSVGAGIMPGAVAGSGNNTYRPVSAYLAPGSGSATAQGSAQNVPIASGLTHYYELIFTSVAGQPNQFTVQWAIDTSIIGPLNGGSPVQLAPSGDTGVTGLYLNLPRNGQFTVVDDMYTTNMTNDPTGAYGQQGTINIIPDPLNGDSSTQFSTSNAGSHASIVNTTLSNSEGSIYSATQGQTDVFNTNPTIPANYRVQAVIVEGYFAKYSGAGANGAVGVVSGTKSVQGSQGAGTGFQTGYSQLIQTTDPNTGAAWTAAGLQSMKVSVTKTT